MSVEIKIIEYGSDEYLQTVRLREKILRHPLGMKFTQEYLLQDKDNIHIAAIDNDKVIGTVLLKPVDKETIKVRQVTTDYNFQGKGIGRKLMEFSEEYASKLGYKRIILHARYYVVDFYKKIGYKIVGQEFVEVAMPHRLMVKELR